MAYEGIPEEMGEKKEAPGQLINKILETAPAWINDHEFSETGKYKFIKLALEQMLKTASSENGFVDGYSIVGADIDGDGSAFLTGITETYKAADMSTAELEAELSLVDHKLTQLKTAEIEETVEKIQA